MIRNFLPSWSNEIVTGIFLLLLISLPATNYAQTTSCLITATSESICQGASTTLCAPTGFGTYQWSDGSTSQCIEVSTAGTYTVTASNPRTRTVATDGENVLGTVTCSKTISVLPLPNATISSEDNLMCEGKTMSLCAPAGNVSYLWNTGETTGCINVSAGGTYSVKVIGLNGCTAQASKSISTIPAPKGQITGTNSILCQGAKASLCAPPDYASYSWNNGSQVQCIDVVAVGTYSVVVTASNGCSASFSQEVVASTPLALDITGTDGTLCDGVTASLCASNGFSSYRWSNGATSQCLTTQASGLYSVTATQADGCTYTASQYIQSVPMAEGTISGSNGTLCQGSTVELCAESGYSKYLWNTGATTQCITVSAAGTYSVTATDPVSSNLTNVCGMTASQVITSNQAIQCSVTGKNNLCAGESAQLCATPGMASYQWSNGERNSCITASAAGEYSVTVSDEFGCTATASHSLTQSIAPVCNGPQIHICQDGSTVLCAPEGMSSYSWNSGTPTSNSCLTVTSPGYYTVQITDSTGCNTICSHEVIEDPQPVCEITGGSATICPGQAYTLCASDGFDSYEWQDGSTSKCITVSGPGTYSVTATGTNSSCVTTASKTITQSPAIVSISGGNGSLCPGQTASICATAGFASYSWSNGETTDCINVNAAGNYSVTATNANGCTSSASTSMSMSTTGNCLITGDAVICAGKTTELCAPSGYSSYIWSNGATTSCITVQDAGDYSVTVSGSTESSNSCSATCTMRVSVQQPVPCPVTASRTTICPNQVVSLCGADGFASYSWNNGNVSRCLETTVAGEYAILATDQYGCTSTSSVTLTQGTVPLCEISGNEIVCAGKSQELAAPSGYNYHWNNGATTRTINVNTTGTYSVTITEGGAEACPSTCSKNITVTQPPACLISGSDYLCPGSTVELCAPAGYSYRWSNGSTSSCLTVSSQGTYTVTLTDANGCTSSCSKTVTQTMSPPCSISGNSSFCQGSTMQLCASPGLASYSWSNGATTQCISINTPGTYSVTSTSFTGCTTTCSKTVSYYVPSSVTISGNNSFCQGGSTQLCATPGFASYLWSNGATTSCIDVNTQGIYSVIATGSQGCINTASLTVNLNNAVGCVISGNNSVCSGGSTEICAPSGGASYLWSNGETTSCIQATAGTYSVTVTSAGGCTSTCTKTLTPVTQSSLTISGDHEICPGSTTSLCAPSGYTSYSWSNGSTSKCIAGLAAGTYTVTMRDLAGCTYTSSKTISNSAVPSCSIAGSNTICSGTSQELCVPAGMASYEWNNGSTGSCLTISSQGTYSVTVTNSSGCSSTCVKTVSLASSTNSYSITGNSSICQGNSTSLCAPSGFTSYLWSNGETSKCIATGTTGNYTVKVTDAAGCTYEVSKYLSAYPCTISLTVTPDRCEVMQGTPTAITFTYVVKNNGTSFPASGSLIDDNGTYQNTQDDIVIGSWGPLAPGESATFTRTVTLSSDYSNVVVASGISAGTPVNAVASATISSVSCSCDLSYPDNSNLPRSAVVFNESEILRASDPGTTTCGTTGAEIKLWYNDEHALTLGVSSVIVKTSSGTTTTNYPVSPTPNGYGCVEHPMVGTTIASGDQSGNDVAAGDGRPLWPALFITDLTVNGPNSRAGDWQQGGQGVPPSRVCGTWKSATRIVDKTSNPAKITVTPSANPPKNNWNLGAGSHTPPGGFASLEDEGYGAEIVWNVDELGLIPGHTYRLQFMVHDGDQNKTGGDVGQNCTTIHIPSTNCASKVSIGDLVWSDENKNGRFDSNEKGIAGLTVKLYKDDDGDNNADGLAMATTTTNKDGQYKFNALLPGNYIVGVTLGSNDSLVSINGGDPDNNVNNDNNGVTRSGAEVRSYTITLDEGSEPVNDGDGANGNLTVDFAIFRPAPELEKKCYQGTVHNFVIATQTWFIDEANQTATIRTIFSKNFVDNTYGTGAIGWNSGHTFNQLVGSDKLQLSLLDVNNDVKMQFNMDYISASSDAPSGYKSLGPIGGDGSMMVGSAADIVSWSTSLDKNFNEYDYVLTANSPSTDNSYKVSQLQPDWIYEVWYEVTVKLSAFPAGFGEPLITSIHASPSKTGSNTEPMEEQNCVQAKVAARVPVAPTTRNINVYVYPNPSTTVATFAIERANTAGRVVAELYTITGTKVVRLFDEEIEPNSLYRVDLRTDNIPPGTYTYMVVSEDKILSGKLIIVH